jgi:hypothetical protein
MAAPSVERCGSDRPEFQKSDGRHNAVMARVSSRAPCLFDVGIVSKRRFLPAAFHVAVMRRARVRCIQKSAARPQIRT